MSKWRYFGASLHYFLIVLAPFLQSAPDAVFSTAVTPLKAEDAFDPNRVKCVIDNHGYAIYFSRGLVPYNKYDIVSNFLITYFPLFWSCWTNSFISFHVPIPPDLGRSIQISHIYSILVSRYDCRVLCRSYISLTTTLMFMICMFYRAMMLSSSKYIQTYHLPHCNSKKIWNNSKFLKMDIN